MRAIRAVNPDAQLVQTEDLGRTYSTPPLAELAAFYNQRRWLSLDLLCGRVTADHPLHRLLLEWGIDRDELAWHVDHPCPPDIIGVNHYATSDRYLDHEVDRYGAMPPLRTPDGLAYTDIEAVRASGESDISVAGVLRDAWERYGLPLAITEVHLGATREEQLRWLQEFWDDAVALRRGGVDVRAVTVWALLGSFDWNVLVTRRGAFYEPGPFDLRGPAPRPTALATLMRDLAAGRPRDQDPLLALPGWWRRPDRVTRPRLQGRSVSPPPAGAGVNMRHRAVRPLVILGATGTLGTAFARACDVRGIAYRTFGRREVDLEDARSVDTALAKYRPWAVVNAAGYVRIDEAERDAEACMRINAIAAGVVAASCSRHDVQLVCFSSDLVFDGRPERPHQPYVESDPVSPLSVYGRSKAAMEQRVFEVLPEALLIRTAALFGPWDRANFVTRTILALARRQRVPAALDAVVSPTYVVDLANAVLDLMIDGEQGTWHVTNRGALSWAELATLIATMRRLPVALVDAVATDALHHAAPRPRYSVLDSERGFFMPTLEDALTRYSCDVAVAPPRTQRELRRPSLAPARDEAADRSSIRV